MNGIYHPAAFVRAAMQLWSIANQHVNRWFKTTPTLVVELVLRVAK